ncbi:MAG TPA: PIG-L family deacetylase [Anaerolineales bacterium]|nr:PIG-L family deacetylase [Anaerolineales bacterium]
MRIIYLSPHLDDAVLSAGGLIRAQSSAGAHVEIWTCMAGIPEPADPGEFARMMHLIWGFADGRECVTSRRLEDQRAAALVGALPVHLDFLDCLYRRGSDGQALYADAVLPVQPDDSELPAAISRLIAGRLQPDDMVVCQLAIGRHVDHVIVRQAAEMLDRPLTYDADMPYLLNHPGDLEPATTGMLASLQPVSEGDYRCWLEAIDCYTSQVASVFGSHEVMHQVMDEFWNEQHGIRLWEP